MGRSGNGPYRRVRDGPFGERPLPMDDGVSRAGSNGIPVKCVGGLRAAPQAGEGAVLAAGGAQVAWWWTIALSITTSLRATAMIATL